MGVPRAVQASPRPSMAWENCHITSGFSGLPKLGQLVRGPARVLVRTLVSYCSVIQRLEAIVGEERSFLKLSVRSVFSGAKGNQSFSDSARGAGFAMGRL